MGKTPDHGVKEAREGWEEMLACETRALAPFCLADEFCGYSLSGIQALKKRQTASSLPHFLVTETKHEPNTEPSPTNTQPQEKRQLSQ